MFQGPQIITQQQIRIKKSQNKPWSDMICLTSLWNMPLAV